MDASWGGADRFAVELGRDNARTRATEEDVGRQWLLTPFLSRSRSGCFVGVDKARKSSVALAKEGHGFGGFRRIPRRKLR